LVRLSSVRESVQRVAPQRGGVQLNRVGARVAARRWPLGWSDAAVGALLAAATALYLATFPLLLLSPDEPHMLNEARRILGGEVMYRDIFELTTPGWQYVMAFMFRVFGTTLRTARMTAAAIQGLTVALIFVACRRCDVRPWLAGAVSVAYLAVAPPVYPVASYHWLVTALSILLLVLCVGMSDRPLSAFVAGVVVGLVTAIHQQRGVSLGGAVAVIIVAQAWLTPRSALRARWRSALRSLTAMFAGVLIAFVPVAVVTLWRAGIDPVWRALILFPLINYRDVNHVEWGGWLYPTVPPTIFARLLRYSPAVLLLVFVALLLRPRRIHGDAVRGRALTLVLFSLFSIASISYYPDLIHIALIMPIFLIDFAAASEWSLSALPKGLDRRLGWLAASALLLVSGWELRRNLPPPLPPLLAPYQSRFGMLPMGPHERRFYENLDGLLDDVPSRTLFRYPLSRYTYLLLGAHNPTRFEYVLPGLHGEDHIQEVLEVLRTHDVPYVVVDRAALAPADQIFEFIRKHYEPMSDAESRDSVVWRRAGPAPTKAP
jgi:hypothetical protein